MSISLINEPIPGMFVLYRMHFLRWFQIWPWNSTILTFCTKCVQFMTCRLHSPVVWKALNTGIAHNDTNGRMLSVRTDVTSFTTRVCNLFHEHDQHPLYSVIIIHHLMCHFYTMMDYVSQTWGCINTLTCRGQKWRCRCQLCTLPLLLWSKEPFCGQNVYNHNFGLRCTTVDLEWTLKYNSEMQFRKSEELLLMLEVNFVLFTFCELVSATTSRGR